MKPIIAKITLDNRILLIETKPSNLDIIDEYFTYPDFSNCFIRGKFDKNRVKYIHFLTRSNDNPTAAMLPIGMLNDLEKLLKTYNSKYKITDDRKTEEFDYSREEIKNNLGYLTLFDYQIDAIESCLKNGNGIVKAGTGFGKTEVMISLCKLMKKKTLILFARIGLAHDTLGRMQKAGVDAGIVQGKNVDEDHDVVMATVQSSHKIQRDDYEMVLVDECHRGGAEQYQEVLRRYDVRYRFGLSATPYIKKNKLKNARVKAFIGDIIYEVKTKVLVDENRLAKPTIHILPINSATKIYPNGQEIEKDITEQQWQAAENNGIVYNNYRNTVIANLANSLEGQVLILIKRIDQGNLLEEMIKDSIFLYGETDQNIRAKFTQEMKSGKHMKVIASTIFDEGIDIAHIKHVILAGGGQSYIKVIQRIGRGMRIVRDEAGNIIKNEVDIWDFYDHTNIILERHSRERISIVKKEEYDVVEEKLDKKLETSISQLKI